MNDTTEKAPPKKSPPLVDMHAFLETQGRERYRAFIVHGAPKQGKSAFARKVADVTGGTYIDVLATVASTPELAAQVDILDAAFLKKLGLEAAGKGASVVILDEYDFLLPVWGGDVSPLTEIVRKLMAPQTQAILVFVMQTVPVLETLTLKNSAGQSRILRLDEIQGIK